MTSAQVEIPYLLQKSEIELQDGYFSFDEHTAIENDSLFNLSRQQMRAFEMNNSTVMAISFELDSDLRVLEREYETILEALGAIGGLEAIVLTFFSLIISPLSENNLAHYLISKLYTQEQQEES